MGKPRTMYMHLLDGKPASFEWRRERGRNVGHLYFVGRQSKVRLLSELRYLRMEQRWAMEGSAGTEWADHSHYSYVLVGVPGE